MCPQLLSKIQGDTAKTYNLLDQRSYLQHQRKQASRMVTAAAAVLRSRRSLLQLVAVLVTQRISVTLQANMEASFTRQKLQQKVTQLQANKDWGRYAAPDGTIDVGALLRQE